jgi:hypothetical protein
MNRVTFLFCILLTAFTAWGQNPDYSEKLAAELELIQQKKDTDFEPLPSLEKFLLGGTVFLHETFPTVGVIPEGWFIQAEVESSNEDAGFINWSVTNSSNAGGPAPELRINWSPTFTGYSRMVTHALDVGDANSLELFFNHRMSNFTNFWNEEVAVEISTDGGNTWSVIWSRIFNATFGPEQLHIPFSLEGTRNTIHVGFRFSGNSHNIFNWSIDNVLLRSAPQEDLVAGEFTGPRLLVAGQGYEYELTLTNIGLNDQQNYNVNLMKTVAGDDDIVLATAPGVFVEVDGSATVTISYTPLPAHEGEMKVYAWIDFADDQDLANNASDPIVMRVLEEDAIPLTVGEGYTINEHVGFRIPFDFYYKNSLAQVMYYPEELDHTLGTINGLVFYSTFAEEVAGENVKIYLGTTTEPNFFEAGGFIPVVGHTLVYDGPITIDAGQSVILIDLETPFLYTGGNLIVTTNRVFNDNTYSVLNRYYASNTPQYVDRTIRNYSNSEIYNPQIPPPHVWGGYLSNWHPNTSFVLSLEGIGVIEGVVTDVEGSPLEGVRIEIDEYPLYTYTNEQGEYFLYIPEGQVSLSATLFGYYGFDQTIDIVEGETLSFNFQLTEIPQVSVSGFIAASDAPDAGIEGVKVTLEGFNNYTVYTDEQGDFLIENVYINETYTLRASFPEYYLYQATVEVEETDVVLEPILLEEVPFPVSNVVAMEIEDVAYITWQQPIGATEYRYDDGVVYSQLGFPFGNLNSVMGAAHRRHAELHEMSWMLTDESGPYNYVKVWVFALDNFGQPDRNQLLFSQENVPNTHMEWNTFVFPEPVQAPNGFLIGLSAPGFLSLATDNGQGEPWAFKAETQYATNNINSVDFFPLESQDIHQNYLIRAYGYDFGSVEYIRGVAQNKDHVSNVAISQGSPRLSFAAGDPPIMMQPGVIGKSNQKALESYSVFRLIQGEENTPANWDELVTGLTNMEYVDTGWDTLAQGFYRYAVIAGYTNESFSLPAFSNSLPRDFMVNFTINVETNSDDSPLGASVLLTNQSGDPEHVYQGVVPASGILEFSQVWKGTYNLRVQLGGFEIYQAQNIEIDEDGSYDVTLVEIIAAPMGLDVVTEGLNPGEALFRWNTYQLVKLFQHDGDAPDQPDSYFQYWQMGYGVVYDLTPYPDAVIQHMDFFHLQWGLPNDSYPFNVHIVDWDTKELIESVGPIYTQVNDAWENDVDLGAIDVSGKGQVAILMEPLGNVYNDAYPVMGADRTGPSGISVYVNLNNLSNYGLNGSAMGDFLMNLWITTAYGEEKMVQAALVSGQDLDPVATRLAENVPAPVLQLNRQVAMASGYNKALESYDVFLNDMQTPVATDITAEEYLFTGLVNGNYTAGVRAVYTTGASDVSTIDFEITQGATPYEVTFRVHMHAVDGFDPASDQVFITGSMLGWDAPGDNEAEQLMVATDDDPMVYYVTMSITSGTYEYKYFLNAGWDGGEWQGGDNRVVVVDADMVIDNVFGDQTDESLNVPGMNLTGVEVFPNPASNVLHLSANETIEHIRVFDLLGKELFALPVGSGRYVLNVSQLREGIYLLQVHTSGGVHSRRIQIQR